MKIGANVLPKTAKLPRILFIQYANPGAYPPVQHSSRIFATAGCEVLMTGVKVEGTEQLEVEPHKNCRVFLLPACRPGVAQKLHFLWFCGLIIAQAIVWRADWIYVSDTHAAPAGLLLSYCGRWKVVYHEHDTPYETRRDAPKPSLFVRCLLAARRHLARRSELCILPNDARALRFRSETATERPVFCVWNCPSLREVSCPLPKQSKEGLIVFFHGSVVPQRLPLTVIDALVNCPADVRFRFAGYETLGHRGYIETIMSRAAVLGMGDRIEYLGILPRTELLKACGKAHIGLSLMPMDSDDLNLVEMIGASNKPFDYLLCGLALLVTALPEWRRMFVDAGLAQSCYPEDSSTIATALNWFLEHGEDRDRMAAIGRHRIATDWNYDNQFKPVLQQMLGPAAFHEECGKPGA